MIGKDPSLVAGIEARRVGRGLVFGKFMPPTDGHVYLADFAQNACENLTIAVCSLPDEPIPGVLRYGWMKEMFPRCTVLHLDAVMPQEPAHPEDLAFFRLWADALHGLADGARFDAIFASESYGYKMAEVMETRFIPVDTRREMVEISGTEMRRNPFLHWDRLPPAVRPYFVKRVAVAGLPSRRKSAMARALARHFGTLCAGDYAASAVGDFSGNFPGYGPDRLTRADVSTLVRGQIACEEALARQASRLLFADAEPAVLAEWSRRRFQSCAPWIEEAAKAKTYALTLLPSPAGFEPEPPVPGSPFKDENEAFAWWKEHLARTGRAAAVIGGRNWDERLQQAVEAVDKFFFAA